MKLYAVIASALAREANDAQRDPLIDEIENEILPSGSGFDAGCKIDREMFSRATFCLSFGYHHMNDTGFYTGWTEHTVKVRADFQSEVDLKISHVRDPFAEYVYDTFYDVLREEVEVYFDGTQTHVRRIKA